MQYTIESRALSDASNPSHLRSAGSDDGAAVVVDASDAHEAIVHFARHNDYELVSVTSPRESRESIATVRKDDRVFLVRVYAE